MRNSKSNTSIIKAGITFCIVSILCSFNTNAQSTMFGSNAQHSGVYSSSIPANAILSQKWKFKTHGRIYSTAAIAGNVTFIGSEDSLMYALNQDGSLKWKFKSNGSIHSTAAIKDSLLFFNDYAGVFHALNTADGSEAWNYQAEADKRRSGKGLNWISPNEGITEDTWDFYQSSPVYTDTIVYFGSSKYMYAININSHQLAWKYEAPNYIHSTPAIADGLIYFGCWDSKLYALNALTGAPVWSYATGVDLNSHGMEGIQSSPSVQDSIVLIASRDANIYAIHAKTGKTIWSQGFGGSWMPSSFAIKEGAVYTGSSDATAMFALDLKKGTIQYRISTGMYTFSSPCVSNNMAYIGSCNGSLFAIDITNGKIKSRFDTDGRLKHTNLINADGSIKTGAYSDLSGSDYASSVEWVKRVLSGGAILSSPVVNNDVIIFGSADSCVYAVGDNGACKSTLKASSDTLDFGNTAISDTSILISNESDCTDSLTFEIVGNNDLKNSISFNSKNVIIGSKTSIQIKAQTDFSTLMKNKTYKGNIIVKSKANEYNTVSIVITYSSTSTAIEKLTSKSTTRIAPNPFTSITFIEYIVERDCHVTISIYNAMGLKVKSLVNHYQQQGQHSTAWDGTLNNGTKAEAGVYFCVITRELLKENTKLLLVR